MQNQGEQARNIIKQFWNNIYQTRKQENTIMRGNIDVNVSKKMGEHYVIENKSRSNTYPTQQSAKNLQVLNEFDEGEFNFCQAPKGSKLIHFQFEEYLMLDSQAVQAKQEEGGQVHPILINISPIFENHCLLVPFICDKLPQILGADVLAAIWNIFKIAPGIRLGFNSIGASASINHLHFHLFYTQDITNTQKLPIQTFPTHQWFVSKKCAVPVILKQINYKGTYSFVLQSQQQGQNSSTGLLQVFQIITELLIEMNIPHNFIFAQDGKIIYIMIRDFDLNVGWLQMAGVFLVIGDQKIVEESDIIAVKQKLTKNEAFLQKIQKLKQSVQSQLK